MGAKRFFSRLRSGSKCTYKGLCMHCSRVFTCATACTRMRLCQFLYKRFCTQICPQSQLWFTCITWINLKICDIMQTVSEGAQEPFLLNLPSRFSFSLFNHLLSCFSILNKTRFRQMILNSGPYQTKCLSSAN